MKIAIVHDWLVVYGGAERVLEQMINIFPEADIFSLVDYIPEGQRSFLHDKKVTTSFIQTLPFAKKKYRQYLPLMPLAIEQFDLSSYDLIISSSYAVAKGVITAPGQLHISYVHSPIRYAWDMQFQYLKESKLEKGLKSWIARWILHKIRLWDIRTSNGVDYFIANSEFIANRIWKVYRRNSKVIYPPVNVESFTIQTEKEDFFVTASRMVPYKKIDLIVEAFTQMPSKKLYVIGDGPEFKKIAENAGDNVIFMGYQPDSVLKEYMQRAKAFVFAAKEDFGITPLEAQACGTPVIAFGEGGALETVKDKDNKKPTGVFFKEQSVQSLINAVKEFERESNSILPNDCRENALNFSNEIFKKNLRDFISNVIENKQKNFINH